MIEISIRYLNPYGWSWEIKRNKISLDKEYGYNSMDEAYNVAKAVARELKL